MATFANRIGVCVKLAKFVDDGRDVGALMYADGFIERGACIARDREADDAFGRRK